MNLADVLKVSLFLLATYIWGRAFLARHWADWWPPARLAAAILVGWHLAALLTLILGYMGAYHLVPWLMPAVTLLLLWRQRTKFRISLHLSPADTAVLIACGLAAYLLSRLVTPFGLPTAEGLPISGAHYIDSTWHLSLIHQLVRSVPPQNPIFSGVQLANYHYLADLQLALIRVLTGTSVPVIFFRFAPLIIFSTTAILVAALCIALSKKMIAGFLGVWLFLISSNLYYLAPRFFPSPADWPSVAWVDVYSTLGVNFPLTISLSLLCIIWLLLLNRPLPIVKLVLLSSTLLLVKSHTALVFLVALGFYGLYAWWQKQGSRIFLVFLTSAIVSFGLTFLIIGQPSHSLTISPFWFVQTMFASPERLNFPAWELARQYLLTYPGYLGLTRLYAVGLGWFIFFNLGPLVLGLAAFRRHPLLLGLFIAGLGSTMTFIYTGTSTVTIQFFYLAVFASAVGTAVFLARFSRLPGLLAGLAIWLALLPGVTYTQNQYQAGAARIDISADQLEIAQTVASLPSGSQLLDPVFRNGSWFTAYSGHPAYLGDFQTLPPLGLKTVAREADSQAVFYCMKSPAGLGVTYVVAPPSSCLDQASGVQPIFTNSAGSVFLVL